VCVSVEMRPRSNRVDNAANGFPIRQNMKDVRGEGGGKAVQKTPLHSEIIFQISQTF
jgi:hypothetical protein